MKIGEINFDETLPDGKPRYRKLSSGAVRDEQVGKIVAKEMTSDQARDLVTRRWEKYREANADRILKEAQAIDPTIKTREQALALAAGKTFLAILDSEKPRGEDLMKLSQLVGATPTIADTRITVVENKALPSHHEAAARLVEAIERMLRGEPSDVVDGNVIAGELKE